MSEATVVMAVASYPSKADAEHDLNAVLTATHGEGHHVAAALVEKGAGGELTVDRDGQSAPLLCDGAVLGAAFIVVAAPLGIAFLAPVMTTTASWAGVGAVVSHLWHHIARHDLNRMSLLLESAQAALVVVTVGDADITPSLSRASETLVADGTRADLAAAYADAVDALLVTG